jgi:putative Holliday junction resolvase
MVQQKETANQPDVTEEFPLPEYGRIIAIDPGTKRCGLAVCDELRVTTRPLPAATRTSWKKLLSNIKETVAEFDAVAVVVGLPLESDGSESPMSAEARDMARKLGLSLGIPIYLQDERVTSYEARKRIWSRGEDAKYVDSEAAAVILGDFLDKIAT